MQRRTLLTVGVATATLMALAGGSLALLKPARRDGRLTDAGRTVFAAVARAVLGPLLPADAAAQSRAIESHLARIETTIAGMPPAMQAEVDEMITLLASGAGRWALAGLGSAWSEAAVPDVAAALQALRVSSLTLRQQVFHALRDLTNAAHFADPAAWQAIGYPGVAPALVHIRTSA